MTAADYITLGTQADTRTFGPMNGTPQLAEMKDAPLRNCRVSTHGPSSAIHGEAVQMHVILSPVHEQLQQLKTTTPPSLPPCNARLRTKTYIQVLKGMLLLIGAFIVAYPATAPEHDRGSPELQLCWHIAAKYWPLSATELIHLSIPKM